MALSGSVQGTVTKNSNYYTYHFDWSATQDIASNTSTITVRHYWALRKSYSFDSVGKRNYGITIDGQPFTGTKQMNYSPWPSDPTISTATHTVRHNDDGTKTITISTYANGTAASYGPSNSTAASDNCTASATITLDQIPRAAQITDATNFNASTSNPSISYSNPAGNAADVQAAIYNTDGTESYVGYRSISKTGSSYTFNLTDAERSKIINAVPNGTNNMYLRFYLKTYINGTLVADPRYLTRIVTVNRAATITLAPNFTDEDNPTVTYSNPGGNTVSDLQIGIFNPAGSVAYAGYRSISKTGSSYTFSLTDAERQALIKAIPVGQNGVDVSFYLRTFIDGNALNANIVTKTLTIANAMPEISCTLKDIGQGSTNLTNDSTAMIKGFNYIAASMTPTFKKGATLLSQSISNGTQVIDASSGSFSNVEDNTFIFSVTDSFGQTVTKSQSMNLIPYVKLTCNITTSNPTADGDMVLKISGNYFNDKFGEKGVNNSLTVRWRIKKNNNDYGEWINITPDITGNSYKAQTLLTGEIPTLNEALDYRATYTVQAIAYDALKAGGILSTEQKAKSAPVYNWGENNFDINVPLTVDNITCNNIFKGKLELGSYDSNTGEKQENANNYRTVDFVEVEANATYTIFINDAPQKQVVLFYDKNNSFISETRNVKEDGMFVTPGDATYINFRCFQADMTENYANLKVQIIKASPIKTRTLNGCSILGSGNLEVGSPAIVLYENQDGSNQVITMNDSAANYEYLEIFFKDQFNGTAFNSVKIPSPNGKTAQLTVMGKNGTSSNYMRIVTAQIIINNNTLTPALAGVGYTNNTTWWNSNEVAITRVVGYAKTGLIYVNGDEVGY